MKKKIEVSMVGSYEQMLRISWIEREQSGCLKGNRSGKETDTYNQKQTTENSGTLYEDCRPGEFNIHRSEFLMKTR